MASLAHSLRRLEAEVNRQFPRRDHWSDGWLGDDSHATRFSDHNPSGGWVHAYDFDATLTHSMGSGTVGDYIARQVLAGCRSGRLRHVVNYVIYKRVIYTAAAGYRGRRYIGSNPHDSHIHISIHRTAHARGWSGWWGILLPTIDASRTDYAFAGHPTASPTSVARVQRRLEDKGFLNRPYHHGRAGRKTKRAMRSWQGRNGFKADGVPGYTQLVRLAGGHYKVVR